jgi:hypothetical protein
MYAYHVHFLTWTLGIGPLDPSDEVNFTNVGGSDLVGAR